jgi:hypothetical protein
MNHGKPYSFMCSCGKEFFGRPGYYRALAHRIETGHSSKNSSTNDHPGKGRRKAT